MNAVPDIVILAKRKQGLENFLQKLDEAIRELPQRGTVPQQAGLEQALQFNLANTMAIAQMLRGQLG